jgi:phosphohistidine phosphatase
MPHILIFRHGIAEDLLGAERAGRDERRRLLTEEGITRTREVCLGLRELLPDLDRIVTSPLTRAVQTAQILQQVFGSSEPEPDEALAPGAALLEVCRTLAADADHALAVVGHEPDLGRLCSLLLTGEPGDLMDLKKSGAVLIHSDAPGTGDGILQWMLPPRVSRRLVGE